MLLSLNLSGYYLIKAKNLKKYFFSAERLLDNPRGITRSNCLNHTFYLYF